MKNKHQLRSTGLGRWSQVQKYLKTLKFWLGNSVRFGNDWDDVNLAVQLLHANKVEGFQSEKIQKRKL